ncbi:hypothetical protein BV20DRAFT_986923 [Pilatotrama ljubarskyi]|nr:hypothetical protein BV20DRAFT_986923 [Pilatotrama ljubarskyi]
METNSSIVTPIAVHVGDELVLHTVYDHETQRHTIVCDLCGLLVYLTKHGNSSYFFTHRRSNHCRKLAEQRRLQEEQARVSAILNTMGSSCKGALVEWKPGSVWSTYPYHRHAKNDLPWEPVAIENDHWLRIRSEDCTRYAFEGEGVCPTCSAVPTSLQFDRVMKRAISAADHTPWMALTYKQLHASLRKTRKLSVARRRITDNQRLVMLLASHDVHRLRRLLTVALRKGASPRTLISRIEQSIEGLYTPRGGFSSRELDVAFLAKALGGPQLLYALAHSHGLPSATTVSRHTTIPHLLPCISKPTESEMSANITALCNPQLKPAMLLRSQDLTVPEGAADEPGRRPTAAGLILMIDGVALEERCRYDTDRNSILGLCREHSQHLRTRVTGLDVVKEIEQALHGSETSPTTTCCYGKDGTVAAIAPYAKTDYYTPVPVLLSPSCKHETGEELADWIRTFLDVWRTHPCGELVHGPVWALASDGESSFRRARFVLCMTELLERDAPLGRLLRSLRGLNCYTGPRGLCGTCDPKHVIKRFATLARNPKGILVSDTLLTCHDLFAHLQTLPGITASKARQLLDPTDKQNVPKAVNLLQSLIRLEDDTPAPDLPSAAHRRLVLSFLAQTLGYFLLPFISIQMSLSDQIRLLATYAHLIAALWIKHGTKFMTGALYADSQAIIKNIVITVARLQLVDPDLPFYIILEGTDRLEGLFGDCRTQDHNRNFDALQLAEKLATSALIQGIFERDPALDRGHQRLALKDAMGVDHVNPRSWIGNVKVGDVELAAEWARGRAEANTVLEKYLGSAACVDFDAAFPDDGGRDLLRPLGVYVGCHYDPDDARTEAAEPACLLKDLGDGEEPDPHAGHSSQGGGTTAPVGDDVSADGDPEGGFDDEPEGVGLDDFLRLSQRVGNAPQLDSLQIFSEDAFLEIDGKSYLKASVVTIFLTAKRSRKATMRILRVRGVTLEDLHGRTHDSLNMQDLDGEDLIKCGDIAAVLIRIGGMICLAVVEILEFQTDGERLRRTTSVELSEMEREDSPVKALVQVLRMRKVQDLSDDTADTRWLWDHQYAQFESEKRSATTGPKHTFLVPGALLFPLGPSVVAPPPPAEDEQPAVGHEGTAPTSRMTWSLSAAQLEQTLESAWSALNPQLDEIVANIDRLPFAARSDALPYKDETGPQLIVKDIPELLSVDKLSGNRLVPCFLCGEKLTVSRMRNHVDVEPCGFCGREGKCTTHLSKRGSSYKISSSCPYHYTGMSYASACKTTVSTPSTNVPIHCPFCPARTPLGEPRTIWKYNAMVHLLMEHCGDDNSLPDLPPRFIVDMHISKTEELAMGIATEWTDKWREENAVPDSDDIEEAQQELVASEAAAQKRSRAESTTVGIERNRKTVRTR